MCVPKNFSRAKFLANPIIALSIKISRSLHSYLSFLHHNYPIFSSSSQRSPYALLFLFSPSFYPLLPCSQIFSGILVCFQFTNFSSLRFIVVGFILRSLIPLDLSFVHGDRYGSIYILLHVDIQLC